MIEQHKIGETIVNQQLSGNVYLFADEWIKKAIKELLQTSKISFGCDTNYSANDMVWVFAHANSNDNGRRADNHGLRWLQAELAKPEALLENPILIFGFQDLKRDPKYSYLLKYKTIRFTRLPIKFVLQTTRVNKLNRLLAKLHASQAEIEPFFLDARHRFSGLAAAVRIYFGMLLYEHTNEGHDINEMIQAMIKTAKDSNVAVSLNENDVGELENKLSAHKELITKINKLNCPKWPKKDEKDEVELHGKKPQLKIWMLDDEIELNLWDKVVPIICEDNGFRGFKDWDSLKAAMEKGDFTYDTILLLDCNLGKNENGDPKPTGLELLAPIRAAFPENRIVMMSRYDDAQLALTCMRAGANAYFVKELADPKDRKSRKYYRKFLEALVGEYPNRLKGIDKKLDPRLLWRRFKEMFDNNGNFRSPEDYPNIFEHQLRLAFYIAFTHLESMDRAIWGDIKANVLEFSPRAMVLASLAHWDFFPNRIEETAAQGIYRKARHGESVTFKEALMVLKILLDNASMQGSEQDAGPNLGDPCMPNYCPYTRQDLVNDSRYPGLKSDESLSTHKDAGIRGAKELQDGYKLIKIHSSPGRCNDVLVIDDEGNSGDPSWFKTLNDVFPGIRTLSKTQFDTEIDENIAKCLFDRNGVFLKNAGLLDLKMPEAKNGFDAFNRLKSIDLTMPIIFISASTETLNAIKCIKHGALDYISKSLPGVRGPEQCEQFCLHLEASIKLARQLGKSPLRRFLRTLIEPDGLVNAQVLETAIDRWKCNFNIPKPASWPKRLADYLSLIAVIRYKLWQIESRQVYPTLIFGVDYWRLRHIICTESEANIPPLIRLICSFAGIIVDDLLKWGYCINNQKPFIPREWGSTNGVNLSDAAWNLLGSDYYYIWKLRNSIFKGPRPVIVANRTIKEENPNTLLPEPNKLLKDIVKVITNRFVSILKII